MKLIFNLINAICGIWAFAYIIIYYRCVTLYIFNLQPLYIFHLYSENNWPLNIYEIIFAHMLIIMYSKNNIGQWWRGTIYILPINFIFFIFYYNTLLIWHWSKGICTNNNYNHSIRAIYAIHLWAWQHSIKFVKNHCTSIIQLMDYHADDRKNSACIEQITFLLPIYIQIFYW